jgi:hypothetical protein
MLLPHRRHLQRVLQQLQVVMLSSMQGRGLCQHMRQQLVGKQRSPTAVTILATATLEWRARRLQSTAQTTQAMDRIQPMQVRASDVEGTLVSDMP